MTEILKPKESDNTDAQILIISTKFDPHVDIIAKKLNERKIPFVRFNTEDFPLKASVNILFKDNQHAELISLPFNRNILGSNIKAVWYRRPSQFEFSADFSPSIQVFAEQESRATIMGLWEILDCVWVNHPENNRRAELKINQLMVASKLGLEIPNTLITNDPEKAQGFFKEFSSKGVIVKRLGSGLILEENETTGIYTSIVKEEDVSNIERVRYAPTLFQGYIPKELELRLTVVGKKVFATEIHSQKSERGKVDWRKDTLNILHRQHELPKDLELKILGLVNYLGLNFGAIDMVVTPGGRYVFLEINPNGQWGWIEDLTGVPISDALIDILIDS